MRRREFIGIAGVAIAWPLVARAQQGSRLPKIGFLGPDASSWRPGCICGATARTRLDPCWMVLAVIDPMLMALFTAGTGGS